MQKLAALANLENFESDLSLALDNFVLRHGDRIEYVAPREAFEAGYRARSEELSLPDRVRAFFDKFEFRAIFETGNGLGLRRLRTDITDTKAEFGVTPETTIEVATKHGIVKLRIKDNGDIEVESPDWTKNYIAALPGGGSKLTLRPVPHEA